jgi:ATP-dependent Clp protease ATP-binding subunit ClpB
MDCLVKGSDLLKSKPNFKLVGRDDDLKRLTSILIRKKSNSVLLVGAGGVGVTALLMGLEDYKNDPQVPFDIVSKRLFWLDINGLFAPADSQKVNATFQKILQVLYRTPDSVLIVEDAKDFIDGARSIGSTHFVNALSLAVKENKTQIIWETKDDDLEFILKSHSDFSELYTLMDLQEPTGENLKIIVATTAKSLGEYHDIAVDPTAMDTSIELTTKYRTHDAGLNRAQPERSITLLDRAFASYRLAIHRQQPQETQLVLKDLFRKQREGETQILALEEELDKQKEAEASRADKLKGDDDNSARNFHDFVARGGFESPAVRAIQEKVDGFQAAVDQNRSKFDAITHQINASLSLTRDMVLKEFSVISGISVDKLSQDETEKLKSLEKGLNKRIFGQAEATKKLANAVKVARVGRRNKDKPQAAFLFLGPSGVGKTEIAKALSFELMDDEKALSRFDMSEYMEKHAVAKMIGAPPGYEGFEAGGILTNLMRKNGNRILLFDEIEKAHPDVFNIFLQILSDGRLTDNVGRTVWFSDAIIIMTTNIGQVHFLEENLTVEQAEAEAFAELASTYRSEFLNRFNGRQNIVCFKKLELDSIQKIVKREIDGLSSVYAEKGILTKIEEKSIEIFCQDHYDPKIGARGLPGYIVSNLEPIYTDIILEKPGWIGTAMISYSKVKKTFNVKVVEKE